MVLIVEFSASSSVHYLVDYEIVHLSYFPCLTYSHYILKRISRNYNTINLPKLFLIATLRTQYKVLKTRIGDYVLKS